MPWIPLLDEIRSEETLGDDPHPNAATLRAMARFTAASLLELGWFGAGGQAPAADPPLAARRAPPPSTGADLLRQAEADRATLAAMLRRSIEPALGEGLFQVYGGLTPRNLIGPKLLAALPRHDREVEVALQAVAGRPDLLPLRVVVELDGQPAGTIELTNDQAAPVSARFTLPTRPPTRLDGAASVTVDVLLRPERYGVVHGHGGGELGACRLIRLALLE